MLLIQLLGGLVAGVFSDEPSVVGTPVAVSDYDSEAYAEDDLVDMFDDGAKTHLHVEHVQALGNETADWIQKWRDQQ